jgi:hypothetical protein
MFKPYKVKVKYEMCKQFEKKFSDVKYRVFNKMMMEDEELRRRYQEQPYEATTSTLLN